MNMNTIELNIDEYKSMLKELGVLKTENEELKNRLSTIVQQELSDIKTSDSRKRCMTLKKGGKDAKRKKQRFLRRQAKDGRFWPRKGEPGNVQTAAEKKEKIIYRVER